MGNLKKSLATIKEPGMFFVDFRLEPGVNGVDVLNLLKNENKWSKTKYIALTADIAEKGYLDGAGFDDVIFKPVTEALLAEIIRKHA
jgi:CheY-like chemotaxis protein